MMLQVVIVPIFNTIKNIGGEVVDPLFRRKIQVHVSNLPERILIKRCFLIPVLKMVFL